jgi:hypothetical protein
VDRLLIPVKNQQPNEPPIRKDKARKSKEAKKKEKEKEIN